MDKQDYIGPDPVAWLDRLIDVNDGSSFHPETRAYINGRLRELRGKVESLESQRAASDKARSLR